MPQSPDFRYDVFLSHNTGDKPQVRRLAERLKKAGLRVWFDEWVIRSGDDIYLAIERGLGAARVQVLCLSPAALGSDWVALERSTVLFRDPTNAGRSFIPLMLADCELPDALRRYKYVDFREEAEAAFGELLTACRVATEEVPELSPPEPAETARPTLIERPVRSKRAERPPASQPKPKEKKRPPVKSPEQTEPLAVLERKLTGHKGWVNTAGTQRRRQRSLRRGGRAPSRLLDQPAGRCVSRHPPERRNERPRNHPLDERDALPQEPEGTRKAAKSSLRVRS